MHWNMISQTNCNSEKLSASAPILKFQNRLRLMVQHFKQVNPDIVGVNGIDALDGANSANYHQIIHQMQDLGYDSKYQQNTDLSTGSAIFYKRDKYDVLKFHALTFSPIDSQFIIFCCFCSKDNPDIRFLFAETELNTDAAEQLMQAKFIADFMQNFIQVSHEYTDIPIIIGGNFQEEPESESIAEVMGNNFLDLYTLA